MKKLGKLAILIPFAVSILLMLVAMPLNERAFPEVASILRPLLFVAIILVCAVAIGVHMVTNEPATKDSEIHIPGPEEMPPSP